MDEAQIVYRLDESSGENPSLRGCTIKTIGGKSCERLRIECCKEHAAELVDILNRFGVSVINYKEVARDWLYCKTVVPIEEQL